MNKTCCFTGHRPSKLFGYDLSVTQYQTLAKLTYSYCDYLYTKYGVRNFISGGALGFDTVAFFAVNSLKSKYPDIQNILAIPFAGQENAWRSKVDKDRYNRMKSLADSTVLVENLDQYKATSIGAKLNQRNLYMVDNSDFVIACWNGTTGGTCNCLKYAHSKSKTLFNIYK